MLQNPSNLYSGGQGILRDNVVDYVTNLELKKRAREDALDKYYGGLPQTVNDKGVRDQEIPILHEAKNRIQQYWMQNRDDIRKGNTPAAFNYGKMFREAQGLVQESKNRAATAEKLAKLRGNPKFDYIFRDPKLVEQIDMHERPVGAEGATGINFDQITLPPPPFDQQKYRQGLKDIKPEYDITYEANPQDKFSKFEVKTPKLNQEQKNRVVQYAASQLYNDPSFEDEIKVKVKSDPTLAPALQKRFQAEFGRDISSDADLATAYTLNTLPFPTERKMVSDFKAKKDYEFKQGLQKLGASDAYIRARMKLADGYKKNFLKFKNAQSQEEEQGIVTKIIDDQFNNSDLKYDGAFNVEGRDFGKGRFVQPTVGIVDKYTVDKGFATEKKPDMFYMTEDKKFVIPAKIQRNEDGSPKRNANGSIKWSADGFAPVPIQNYRTEIAKEVISKKNQGSEVIDEFLLGDENPQEYEMIMSNIEKVPNPENVKIKEGKTSKWDKYRK